MDFYKQSDFYVILPSASSDSTDLIKSSGNFRTKLPETISFNKPWEVALSSLTFSNTSHQFPLIKDRLIRFNLKNIIGVIVSEILETVPENDSVQNDGIIRERGIPPVPSHIIEEQRQDDLKAKKRVRKPVVANTRSSEQDVFAAPPSNERDNITFAHISSTGRRFKLRPTSEKDTAADQLLIKLNDEEGLSNEFLLQKSQYDSIDELLNEINLGFKEMIKTDLIKFGKQPDTSKLVIEISKLFNQIEVSERLCRVLGLNSKIITTQTSGEIIVKSEKQTILSELDFDLNQELKQIFIYCDIVSSQIVGNTYAQLLYTLPLHKNQKEIVEVNPIRSYMNVDRTKFDSIRILICDQFGELLEFDKSSVIVGLHFRPKI